MADEDVGRETIRAIASPGHVPAGFLVRLASAVESRVSGPLAGDSETAGSVQGSATWDSLLGSRCREVGLRAKPIELDAGALSSVLGRRRALVTWDLSEGWLALASGRNGQVRIIGQAKSDTAPDLSDLGRKLGDGLGGPRTWVVVEPTLADAVGADAGPPPPFRRLLAMLASDRGDLMTIVLYAIFIGLFSLATPISVQQLVNSVAFGGLIQPVVVLAALLFLGLVCGALLATLQAWAVELIQRRVFVRACVDLADRLPRVAPSAYDGRNGVELVNRFFDLTTLQKTGAGLLLSGTSLLLQTVTGLAILSFYHPLMLGFGLVLVAAIAFVVIVLGRNGTGTAVAESNAKYALGAWMEELVRTPSLFADRRGRLSAARHADDLAAAWVDARQRHFRVVLRQIIASVGLQVVANTALLALGGILVVSGQLTLGQLVASEIIVAAVVAAFARLGKMLESWYDLMAAVDKVGVLLDLPVERTGGVHLDPTAGPARVELRDLQMSAGGQSSDAMSLKIEAGERVALKGPSGSGKSALLDVLLAKRSASGGRALIDGEDIELLDLEHMRSQVMLLRDIQIHTGTIAENVRVARPDATTAEVEEALARVGLLAPLERMPGGIHTKLEPGGGPLSRGQAQQLMLARVVLARPRLLLVDAGLVELDVAARNRATEVLLDPHAPWTLLIASNDATWLPQCDRVIELSHAANASERTQDLPPPTASGMEPAA